MNRPLPIYYGIRKLMERCFTGRDRRLPEEQRREVGLALSAGGPARERNDVRPGRKAV